MAHNHEAFLKELTALTRKHMVEIDSCGCCKGVWIEPVPFVSNDAHYTVNEDGTDLKLVNPQ
jgi:hypothetical protein